METIFSACVYIVSLITHKYIFSRFGDIQNMKVENLNEAFTVLAIVAIFK